MKKSKTEFQRLLRLAVGSGRTQKAFCEEAMISPSHLSRMMNQADMPLPTIQMLQRIADCSEGRVTVEQLTNALEEDKPAPDTSDSYEPYMVRYRRYANGLISGLRQFAGTATVYQSLSDVLSLVVSLYLPIDGTVEFQLAPNDDGQEGFAPSEPFFEVYHGIGHKNAESFCNCRICWSDTDAAAALCFVVFCSRTVGGGVVISDVVFDLQTLIDCNHIGGNDMLIRISEKENADISKYQTVLGIARKGDAEGISAERLMAILGLNKNKGELQESEGDTKQKE